MAARPIFAAWLLLSVFGVLAVFASPSLAQFTITASAGANGSISPDGAVVVDPGADQGFTITPDLGYHVADVLVDGASIGAVLSHTFTNVTADHTIAASFAIDTYTITASAGANGSITPNGAVGVDHGADQGFTITPDLGYHVADVLVDGASIGAVLSHTFTNVTEDHTIAASFAIDTYTITASAGANGSITPNGAIGVDHGADQGFSITPDVGYQVADVLVDGASIGAVLSHTFTNVTEDHTIEASFAVATYTITASAGANGSITPSGAIVVNHGASQNFTFTPAVGHHVTDVLVDGASVGVVTSYNFTNVTADHTIAVSFAFSTHHSSAIAISPDGREAWVVNPDHGSVSVLGLQAPDENQLLAEIPVGAEPWSVDIHPTNGEVWVTSMAEDKVYIIDADSRSVVGTIATGFETFAVAFNPAGTTALVTASGADKVHAINVATRTVTNTMFVYRRPRGIAWKSDGSRAWVSHLLMPELTGRLTAVNPSFWTTSAITLNQVFALSTGGYPSTMQNLTLFPAPTETILWIPNNMINTAAGDIAHNPLTPFKIFHATIRPVDISVAQGDQPGSTYYLSASGAPVGGPIAVDFKDGKAYVANLHSDNVTVLTASNPLAPTHLALIAAGKGPIGIVTHPTLNRAYVANWLSRSVTVIDTDLDVALTEIPTVTDEVLSPELLNGKQLFYTSTGALSMDGRGSCASCHVFDRSDARPWDLSQFGKHLRATPDIRGIGNTGAHDWTADKDEMQDHNFGILEFTGGAGLIPFPNPPLGAPNAGLSQDMDDMALYMTSVLPRRGSPFRNPDGSHTANALVGEAIFNDPAVGCATCHVPPFYTDSKLTENPFIRHIVGTADPADADAAAGFDTPSLINLWDSGPYLHDHLASSAGATAAPALMKVLTVNNPDDLHGVTSTLTSPQRSALVSFLLEITWPDSTITTGIEPPASDPRFRDRVDGVFPNPFRDETSLRFSIERSPSKVQIDLFDVAGRHVRTLLDREMARGTHIVGWDSRDAAGREVAAGSYFARLIVNGKAQSSKRMAVLR